VSDAPPDGNQKRRFEFHRLHVTDYAYSDTARRAALRLLCARKLRAPVRIVVLPRTVPISRLANTRKTVELVR